MISSLVFAEINKFSPQILQLSFRTWLRQTKIFLLSLF